MQSKRWCFTINNYSDEEYHAISFGVGGMLQGELAPDTGTRHLQGFCIFDTNQRLGAMKKLHSTAHFEIMKGTIQQNIAYVTKSTSADPSYPPRSWGVLPQDRQGARSDLLQVVETIQSAVAAAGGNVRPDLVLRAVAAEHPVELIKYTRGIREFVSILSLAPELPPLPSLFPWQSMLLQCLQLEPNDRTIIWHTDLKGNAGKSTFVNFYLATYPDDSIVLSGKVADMAYAYNGQRVAFFDVTRTQVDLLDHLMSFAESLKNGRIFSTKYESRLKRFRPPHVVFFANVACPPGKWSEDRVVEIVLG